MRRYLDEELSRGDDSEINLKTWFGSDEDAKMLYEESYAILDRDMDENRKHKNFGGIDLRTIQRDVALIREAFVVPVVPEWCQMLM